MCLVAFGGLYCVLEVVSRETDIRIGLSTKFGIRTLFWMPSENLRIGVWQNGQRIWIQRAKKMEIGFLVVFFGVRTSENRQPKVLEFFSVHGGAVDHWVHVAAAGWTGSVGAVHRALSVDAWRAVIGLPPSQRAFRAHVGHCGPVLRVGGTRGMHLLGASRPPGL